MTDSTPHYGAIFFEVYEGLPRQGPGNRAATARALAACAHLPEHPAIVDLGCGVGRQSLDLAELTRGTVVAVDNHEPFMATIAHHADAAGLSTQVRPHLADMNDPGLPHGVYDLVWSEGALYLIGVPAGLRVAASLLRPGGYLAFTEAIWRRSDPPAAVRDTFDYPAMGTVDDALALIAQSELILVEHFPLPDEAWWDDFYGPMETRVQDLRRVHADDPDALADLDAIQAEVDMHREFGHYYAYEFFIVRLPG